ncbi:MAG: hypothetical protein IPK28_21755 [Devosia sp.]|nr:hypothetical protein [Devosia sp.]
MSPLDPAPKARRGHPLLVAAAISFSLTFVGAGVALQLDLVPWRPLPGLMDTETSMILLLVPLCALLLALLVEVMRTVVAGGLDERPAPHPDPLSAWRPGSGEG